ncbi:MAG: DUF47 family protein [Thermaerobacter sp.]|nr:DUF47 domain-containing protein [Bacillota bacterium]REJ38032.1 MAG: DUF47 domain-containing protein [Bacillota bacterium]
MFFTSQRDNQFFDLIENAARNALELARLLQQAVDDLAHIDRHAEAAEDLEHRGDDYTHRLVELLNRTFVTPLEREELFDLAVTIDSISDHIEAAISRMAIYRIDEGNGHLHRLGRILEESAAQICEAVSLLRAKKVGKIRDYAVRLNELENEADTELRHALAGLFANPSDPLRVIKFKEIYEMLEEATDACEDVANILEGVAMRHA